MGLSTFDLDPISIEAGDAHGCRNGLVERITSLGLLNQQRALTSFQPVAPAFLEFSPPRFLTIEDEIPGRVRKVEYETTVRIQM